jgi:hypothetical protein
MVRARLFEKLPALDGFLDGQLILLLFFLLFELLLFLLLSLVLILLTAFFSHCVSPFEVCTGPGRGRRPGAASQITIILAHAPHQKTLCQLSVQRLAVFIYPVHVSYFSFLLNAGV